MINKKVNLTLVGLDGNAYSLMGAFMNQAKIDSVLTECKSGDYSHLFATLYSYCNDSSDDDYYEDDSDDDYYEDDEL